MLPERMQRDLAIVNDTQMKVFLSYMPKYDKINAERLGTTSAFNQNRKRSSEGKGYKRDNGNRYLVGDNQQANVCIRSQMLSDISNNNRI